MTTSNPATESNTFHTLPPIPSEMFGKTPPLKINDAWSFLSKDSRNLEAVQFLEPQDENDLLLLEKRVTQTSFNLTCRIPNESLIAGSTIEINFNYSHDRGAIVEYISVIHIKPNGQGASLEKLVNTARNMSRTRVAGRCVLRIPPSVEGRFIVVIRFKNTEGRLTLHNIRIKGLTGEFLPLAPPPETISYEDPDIATSESNRAFAFDLDQILRSDDISYLNGVFNQLYIERDCTRLQQVIRTIEASGDPALKSSTVAAYALLNYARCMLDLNAAETAYHAMSELLNSEQLVQHLLDHDCRRAMKILARSCARSGRIAEAETIYFDIITQHPLDWEPYYQLGIISSNRNSQESLAYLTIAEAKSTNLPASATVFIAETHLTAGSIKDASQRIATLLKENPDYFESYLAYSNIFLECGLRVLRDNFVGKFFEASTKSKIPLRFSGDHPHGLVFPQAAPPRTEASEGPLVTVIMTSFNSSATLEHAISSVLQQTHRNLRLVVVDDASTDHSPDIIRKFASQDPRVVGLFNTVNAGTYCSKNHAIREFESDFYTFHDSDDWMHPCRLAAHLEEAKNDGVALTTSQWIRVSRDGKVVVRRFGGYVHENPASIFVHASVFQRVGFFDSVRTGADSEFCWRVRRVYGHGAVRQLQASLAIGLQHDASLTTSGPAAFDEHRFSPLRLKYWESWVKWHQEMMTDRLHELHIPFPLLERPFPAAD